jgi:predicted ATPase with chaperone activity
MKKVRANYWPKNVALQCSVCFTALGEFTLAQLAAYSSLQCSRCKAHNVLPSELAKLTVGVTPNADADNPPGRAEAFDSIVGHANLRRAIEVAVAGYHTMTIVGRAEDNWQYVSAILGDRAVRIQRCPCGNYQRPQAACECTLTVIEQHQSTRQYLAAQMSDIIVETYTPKTEEIWADFEPWGNVLQRIKRLRRMESFGGRASFDWTRREDGGRFIVRDETYTLLNAARERFDWGTTQLKSVQEVARTIATLDSARAVQPHHMAEAIAYRMALHE